MTMPYSPSRAIYEGNSAATRFPFSFKVWDASQLVVTLTSPGGLTTEASGWTADIGAAGGEIVYLHDNSPLPHGWKLAITRNMPFTQEVNLVSASRFDPQVIEDALDQATAERQQTLEIMRRAVILPATSSETPQDVVLAVYAARDDATAAASSASGSQSAAAASAGAAADSAVTAAQTVEAATATAVTAATAQANRAESEAGRAETEADRAEAAGAMAADSARQAIAEEADRAAAEADRAKTEADRAQSLVNMGPAAADKLGFVKIGEGIAVTEDGTITVTPVSLATPEKAGTVRPGNGMTVEDSGTLNIAYWDAFPPYVPIPVWGVTFGGSDGRRAIMPGEAEAREDWLLCDGGSDDNGGVMPSLLGRTVIGASASETEGTMGGSATHTHAVTGSVSGTTLSTAQMPSHAHSIPSMFTNDTGRHTCAQASYYSAEGSFGSHGSGGNGSHTHALDSATASTASSYMPYCAINFIMKII